MDAICLKRLFRERESAIEFISVSGTPSQWARLNIGIEGRPTNLWHHADYSEFWIVATHVGPDEQEYGVLGAHMSLRSLWSPTSASATA